MDKEIAYEMALLFKENRALKETNDKLKAELAEAQAEIASLRLKLTPSEPKKEVMFFDCETDLKEGDKIVITNSKSAKAMFVPMFVLKVDHVVSSGCGFDTVCVKYQCVNPHRMGDRVYWEECSIKNKTYSWRKVDEQVPCSTMEYKKGMTPKKYYRCVYSSIEGTTIPIHPEYKDLMVARND